jgi:hypothetical protein
MNEPWTLKVLNETLFSIGEFILDSRGILKKSA